MADDLQKGDRADITINGVSIVERHEDGSVTVADEHGNHYPMPPQATVTRVAPAHWPPQRDDIWVAEHGARYFAYSGKEGEMRFMIGSGASWEVGYLHAIYPVRLLERPDKPWLLKSNKDKRNGGA